MYSLDSSAILEAWVRRYPIENFPSFWNLLEREIINGRIFVVRDVLHEIGRVDDGSHSWMADRLSSGQIIDLDPGVQDELIGIMSRYPHFVENRTGRNGADPVIIAACKANGLIVVTQEDRATTFNERKPKIPNVCEMEGVRCISLLGLIRELGWTM